MTVLGHVLRLAASAFQGTMEDGEQSATGSMRARAICPGCGTRLQRAAIGGGRWVCPACGDRPPTARRP
jgi:ribosomal protein L37AE/L43A